MLGFGSATGNLYDRLGRIGKILSEMRTYQSAQLVNYTNTTTGVVAQYNAESDLQALFGGDYINEVNAPGSVGGTLSSAAAQTLNRMIFRDNPRISQNLQALNVTASMTELIRQMKVAGATVFAAVITATPSAFTGAGNGVTNVSTRRPLDGLVLENTFAETVLLTCIADSYVGGAQAGNETL